jgi:hypothetical protein
VVPGQDDAEEALRMSAMIASDARATISLIVIAEEPPAGASIGAVAVAAPWHARALRDESLEEAHERCHATVSRLTPDFAVDYRVACGRPERIINDAIARGGVTADRARSVAG